MKATFFQNGNMIDFTNSTDTAIAAGAVVSLNDERVGIAACDIAAGETGTLAISGVFTVAKAAGTAIKQGQAVKYDATNDNFGVGDTAKVAAGFAVSEAAADAVTMEVKIG